MENMSDIEATTTVQKVATANAATDPIPSKKSKIKFVSATNIHNLKRVEIYNYIVRLRRRIRNLVKKCRQYKKREEVLKLKINRPNLKEDEAGVNVEKESSAPADEGDVASNFIAGITEAAEKALEDSEFTYDHFSRLYMHKKTGYFYNPEFRLYYDGRNECYYWYDPDEKKFVFHSQALRENTETTEKPETTETVAEEESKQTSDDDECVKLKKKKKKSKRRLSSNVESGVDAKSRKERKRRSKKKHSKRREHELDREDGEISEDDDCSDQLRSEKGKRRRRRADADGRPSKIPTIEIPDSTESSIDSDRSFSNVKLHEKSVRFTVSNTIDYSHSLAVDLAKRYPPSIRVIVQETDLKKLKIGELFMITYKGGSLGREGNHDVIIPDINCSKYHLKFTYEKGSAGYKCIDLGSRNGTLLNGKRMSSAKQESKAIALKHGTVLQIGQTKLLCHIHEGHTTCEHCEPGLLAPAPEIGSNVHVAKGSKLSAAEEHKRQLKNIKKRYGLADEKYVESRAAMVKNDRAAQRRQTVGSSCDFEKTKTASLDTSIPSENKGFKMLAKLGWSEGQSLGKNSDGLLEPIALHSNQGTKGLGCEGSSQIVKPCDNPRQIAKTSIWKKTQARYKASDAIINMFKEDDSD